MPVGLERDDCADLARELSRLNDGQTLSRTAAAFCLALACCACERVPASLFYRPCQLRRAWQPSGEIADTEAHFSRLPSWIVQLFGLAELRKARKHDLSSNTAATQSAESEQRALHNFIDTARGSSRRRDVDKCKEKEQAKGKAAGIHGRIPLEAVGLRPDCVALLQSPYLQLPSELQSLIGSQAIYITTADGCAYFVLNQTWQDAIINMASEKLRIRTWALLVTLTAWSAPGPYTEPLWRTLQAQLEEVIQSSVLPFLSVIDLADFKGFSDELQSDLLRLLLHRRIAMGTVSSPYLPFSVNVTHVILHSRPADMKSLARIILFSEELDALMLLPHASMASLDHFLMSLCQNLFDNRYTRYLIFLSVDASLDLINLARNPLLKAALLKWWKAHQSFDNCPADTVADLLRQARETPAEVPAPKVENLDHSVKAALGFALAQRQCLSSARSLLEGCVDHARKHWPIDSPNRSLLLAELTNCTNAQGSGLREELRRLLLSELDEPYKACRFDIVCIKTALCDAHIRRSRYGNAKCLLEDVINKSQLTDDMFHRVVLRLSKVNRRLSENVLKVTNTKLLEKLPSRADGISKSLKLELLEETCNLATIGSQYASNATGLKSLLHALKVVNVYAPKESEDWRLREIEAELDSGVTPFVEVFNEDIYEKSGGHDIPQPSGRPINRITKDYQGLQSPSTADPRCSLNRVLDVLVLESPDNEADAFQKLFDTPFFRFTFLPSLPLPADVEHMPSDIILISGEDMALQNTSTRVYPRIFQTPVISVVSSLDYFIAFSVHGDFCGVLEAPVTHDRLENIFKYYLDGKSLSELPDYDSQLLATLVIQERPRMVLTPLGRGDTSMNIRKICRSLARGNADELLQLKKLRLADEEQAQMFPGFPEFYTFFKIPHSPFRETGEYSIGSLVYIDHFRTSSQVAEFTENVLEVAHISKAIDQASTRTPIDRNIEWSSRKRERYNKDLGALEMSADYRFARIGEVDQYWQEGIRDVIKFHLRNQTMTFSAFLHDASPGVPLERTLYLITGAQVYGSPKLHVESSPIRTTVRKVITRPQLFDYFRSDISYQRCGLIVAKLQVCQINVTYRPYTFRMDKPEWHRLWGPLDDGNFGDDLPSWPPLSRLPTLRSVRGGPTLVKSQSPSLGARYAGRVRSRRSSQYKAEARAQNLGESGPEGTRTSSESDFERAYIPTEPVAVEAPSPSDSVGEVNWRSSESDDATDSHSFTNSELFFPSTTRSSKTVYDFPFRKRVLNFQ